MAVRRLPEMVGIGGDVPAKSIHFESVTKLEKDRERPTSAEIIAAKAAP